MTDTSSKFYQAVVEHGLDGLAEIQPDSVDAGELHHELFNTDYFVIGTYQATKMLEEYGTFRAIEEVRRYELDNFGEAITEVDPEKIANMLAYIMGEEWLSDSATMSDRWGHNLTAEDLTAIREELES